ncbi:hypothetical protein [Armatimonas sp.]|uniref:hypothetical protein n=1 Tax=Armatimonas sp. TaxID=1872638 RepID=UPI003752D6D7
MNGYKSMTDNRFPTLSRRGFLLLGGNAAAGLIGAGCGGGGGTLPTGPLAEDDPASILPTGAQLPTVVSPGARLVPEGGLVNVEDNRVVLSGNVAGMSLAPGLVIASLLGEGFTRRIVNITSDGGSGTVLETSPATLEDAFDSLEIRALSDLTEEGSRQQGNLPLNINIPIPSLSLFSSGAKSVKLSGDLKLGGQMAAVVRIQKGQAASARSLQLFGFKVKYHVTGQMKIKGEIAVVPGSFDLKDIATKGLGRIADVTKKTPTILKPILEVKATFTGGFQPNIAFTTGLTMRGAAGFSWTQANGFSIAGTQPTFDSPSFTYDSSLNPYKGTEFLVTLNPVLKLYVGGVVGPFLDMAAPSVYAKFTRTDDTLFHGLGVSIGANLAAEIGISDSFSLLSLPKQKIFDRQLVNYQKFFDDSAKTSFNIR